MPRRSSSVRLMPSSWTSQGSNRTRPRSVGDCRLGLLLDLFEYEVAVSTLCHRYRVVWQHLGRLPDGDAFQRRVGRALRRHFNHLSSGQEGHALRVGYDGGQVAGQQHFAFPIADHDATGIPDSKGHHTFRLLPECDGHCLGAPEPLRRQANRLLSRGAVCKGSSPPGGEAPRCQFPRRRCGPGR